MSSTKSPNLLTHWLRFAPEDFNRVKTVLARGSGFQVKGVHCQDLGKTLLEIVSLSSWKVLDLDANSLSSPLTRLTRKPAHIEICRTLPQYEELKGKVLVDDPAKRWEAQWEEQLPDLEAQACRLWEPLISPSLAHMIRDEAARSGADQPGASADLKIETVKSAILSHIDALVLLQQLSPEDLAHVTSTRTRTDYHFPGTLSSS
jgi:hypothetical protein